MVGLIPLFAVTNLRQDVIDRLPGFRKRMEWFLNNRQDLYHHISMMETRSDGDHGYRLTGIFTRARLQRVLERLLDEREFLSPFGIRSVSAVYREHPYTLAFDGQEYSVGYDPGESINRHFSAGTRIGADRSDTASTTCS